MTSYFARAGSIAGAVLDQLQDDEIFAAIGKQGLAYRVEFRWGDGNKGYSNCISQSELAHGTPGYEKDLIEHIVIVIRELRHV